nr:hypothetical protein [uncultured Flavobacterium sp.]
MKILILFLFTFLSSSAQNSVDSIIKIESAKLNKKGISNFFFIEKYCVGCISIRKRDEPKCEVAGSTIYLFWRDEKKDYVQKLDKCSSQKRIISNEIMQLFIDHKFKLESENIKLYSTKPDSIANNKIYSFRRTVSHSTFTKFYFQTKDKVTVKKIDDFDLTTNNFEPNVYFDTNKTLIIVGLKNICEKLIQREY